MNVAYQDYKGFHSGADFADGIAAIEKNNAANIAKEAGRYDEAIRLHVEALRLKIRLYGAQSIDAAFSSNMLGDALLAAGRLDKAAEAIGFALQVRDDVAFGGKELGPRIDAAASRDNMARVLEAKGDFAGAREIRLKGADKGHTICGCLKCVTPGGAMLSRAQLKACGACHSVFYCSPACQKRDWRERHKPLCKKYTATNQSNADPVEAAASV